MSNFTVNVKVVSKNTERIDELAARLKDFSVPLSNIIDEWADGNVRKFDESRGAELSGTSIAPVEWEGVTEKYYDQKHGPVKRGSRSIFPDWLMVRTGDLMRALTTRGNFGEYFDQVKAIFGTPLDAEDAAKASYNFAKRPTIFLSESDRLMIRRNFQQYLDLGENYREMLFARAGRLADLQKEIVNLDTQFGEASA